MATGRADMLARIRTAALWGADALAVDCEADLRPGLPAFSLVGSPDTTARGYRDRLSPRSRNEPRTHV